MKGGIGLGGDNLEVVEVGGGAGVGGGDGAEAVDVVEEEEVVQEDDALGPGSW